MTSHRGGTAPGALALAHVLAAVLGVLLIGAGVLLSIRDPAARPETFAATAAPAVTAAPAPRTAPAAPATASPSPAVRRDPTAMDGAPRLPKTVLFESAAVTAPLVPVGVLPSGALQLPDDPDVVGWWAAGAAPGEAQGTVVLAGHLDSAEFGTGAMLTLHALQPGDLVDVASADGAPQRYRVTGRDLSPQDALDPALFTRAGPPRLALITCGGTYHRDSGYEDNVVVLAEPVTL